MGAPIYISLTSKRTYVSKLHYLQSTRRFKTELNIGMDFHLGYEKQF